MKEVDIGIGPCKCSAVHRGKKSFIGKTIDGIIFFMQDAFVTESFSRRRGLLQSLDPRAKLISILALIVATSTVGNLRILVFAYLFFLLVAFLSKIEIGFFIKRVWLFIPIFSGFLVLPLVFNVFFPGDPLIQLIHLGPGAPLGRFHFRRASTSRSKVSMRRRYL
jgi:cobalt/nickel transport system permease protein